MKANQLMGFVESLIFIFYKGGKTNGSAAAYSRLLSLLQGQLLLSHQKFAEYFSRKQPL
jgi:hypothetical protein